MTDKELIEIISRLKNGFNIHRFNEPGVTEEYTKKLAKLNCQRMHKVIDMLIEEDSEKVPAISKLLKVYKTGMKGKGIDVRNEAYCPTCHDRGFILLTEYVRVGEDEEGKSASLPYQFAYYCPYCEVGSQYAYSGKECEEKSDYRIPPITEALPEEVLNDIRKTNLKWKQQNEKGGTERSRSKNLQEVTANIGKDIPEARHYVDADFEPGDAYEEEGLPV